MGVTLIMLQNSLMGSFLIQRSLFTVSLFLKPIRRRVMIRRDGDCIESVSNFHDSIREFDLSNLGDLSILDKRLMIADLDDLSFFLFKCDRKMTLMSQRSGMRTKIRRIIKSLALKTV